MIKVFTLNEKGKIELTKDELEQLLNKSYWEGYSEGYSKKTPYWTYTSPTISYPIFNNPCKITCTDGSMKIKIGD